MNRKNKSILVLGTGNAQIDLIEHCKDKGFHVHACSNRNSDTGRFLVDEFTMTDIKDTDSLTDYCRKKSIGCVYSTGSDIAVPAAAKISDRLGLPSFLSKETAFSMRDKAEVRKSLGDSEFNLPFREISRKSELQNWDCFPAIIKPVDSQGQRGVIKVDSVEEATSVFSSVQKFSMSGRVIIEKFMDGDEISINAYICNSNAVFSVISDREIFSEFPGGIPRRHQVPSQYDSSFMRKKASELVNIICRKFSLYNGPLYIQAKIDGNHIKLIECTPRLDGCHLWRLIEHAYGVNLLDISIQHLIYGEKPSSDRFLHKKSVPCFLEFICQKPGTKVEKNISGAKDCVFLRWYFKSGEKVRSLNGYMEKVAYFIKEGDLYETERF
ncbi:MAG: ATP-grasp domain-containing protein [bacterium]